MDILSHGKNDLKYLVTKPEMQDKQNSVCDTAADSLLGQKPNKDYNEVSIWCCKMKKLELTQVTLAICFPECTCFAFN